jgi:hypothetical protein
MRGVWRAARGARSSQARGARALAAWPRRRRVVERARRDMRQAAVFTL